MEQMTLPILIGVAIGLAIGYVIAKIVERKSASKFFKTSQKTSYINIKRS